MEQLIPFKEILSNPSSAWAVLAIVLVVYVMRDSKSREERLTGIIDTSLSQHGETIARQTETLNNINSSLLSMKDIVTDVRVRVEDIEHKIGIGGN